MVYLMRILVVGDTDVGKTSLLVRFNEGNFTENTRTTIGVDYKAKCIDIDGVQAKLQIWDTAGQERFRSMTSAFYNKAHGVILTFDVTQPDTFNSLDAWYKDIRTYAPAGTVVTLSVNKVDKCGAKYGSESGANTDDGEWGVPLADIEKFCREHGNMQFFCTSGKSGLNVTEMFTDLGRELLVKCKDSLQQLNEDDGSIGGPRSRSQSKNGIVMSRLLDGESPSAMGKKQSRWGWC